MAIPVPGRVVEALRRSTVLVATGDRSREGTGSGVTLTQQRVVTNAHVVTAPHSPPWIESWEGQRVRASIEKLDVRHDLALLGVAGLEAPPAALGDSNHVKAGMPVFAVGNPLGFTGAVSSGVVHQAASSPSRHGRNWIYADVRLAPGNSGGPLADFAGNVIGINTMIAMSGVAIAIPSRAVQTFLSRGNVPRSLGVIVRPVQTHSGLGLMILELVRGGAAEKASLLVGDILAGIDGRPFSSLNDLYDAVENAPNESLRLDFYRAGQKSLRRVTVTLTPNPVSSAA